MGKRNATNIAAVLIIGSACAAIFLSTSEFGPTVDRTLHAEIGRVLAKETLSLLRPGGQITVITRDTEPFPQPALDVLLKSFEAEIRRGGDIKVGTHLVQLD